MILNPVFRYSASSPQLAEDESRHSPMGDGGYPLAKSENSRIVWLDIQTKEKDMPKSVHISLDGRSGARVREFDFDLTPVPVSTRTSKGLTVTKWAIKEVKVNDLSLK